MFKLINGWTKETVMAQIRNKNNGTIARNGDSCAYQAFDGNRCAVGCFIPDGHPAFADRRDLSAQKLLECYPDLASVMPFESLALRHFQYAHDRLIEDKNVYEGIQNFLDCQVE